MLSCLLAFAMAMNGPSPGAVSSPQDSGTPSAGNPQSVAPAPAPPAKPKVSKKAKAGKKVISPHTLKAPDDTKKTDKANASSGPEKETPAVEPQEQRAPATTEPKPPAEPEPHKVVVRHGGAPEPGAQIVPDLPRQQAIEQHQEAHEMLVAAEDRLKLLGERTLNSQQQETVTQIRNYMEKSRAALKDGDTQRGHTLALKAYLLADDLVKH